MSKFNTITGRAGFTMKFANGWTISVQWHDGAYTSREDRGLEGPYRPEYGTEVSSPDAEIAIWDKNGEWYDFGSDQVQGYCTTDEVAQWIAFTKNKPAIV
jgi:hypothetical protein